jgi:hypothetical protein
LQVIQESCFADVSRCIHCFITSLSGAASTTRHQKNDNRSEFGAMKPRCVVFCPPFATRPSEPVVQTFERLDLKHLRTNVSEFGPNPSREKSFELHRITSPISGEHMSALSKSPHCALLRRMRLYPSLEVGRLTLVN